jgi:hypothetical protein
MSANNTVSQLITGDVELAVKLLIYVADTGSTPNLYWADSDIRTQCWCLVSTTPAVNSLQVIDNGNRISLQQKKKEKLEFYQVQSKHN